MVSVPLWCRTEIDLTSAGRYANPYADVDVTVEFAGPGGERILRPAFWDGGASWKVRFAPTAIGPWRWRSTCSQANDAGLHGVSGQIEAGAYDGDNPVYRHGFLRISDNRRHFGHADGQPFFWLGDTHWQMPDTERPDACNHPEHGGGPCPHGGQFQHLAADRKARGPLEDGQHCPWLSPALIRNAGISCSVRLTTPDITSILRSVGSSDHQSYFMEKAQWSGNGFLRRWRPCLC